MRLFLPLMMLTNWSAPPGDGISHGRQETEEPAPPVRIFERGAVENIRSARIIRNRPRDSDASGLEEIEICHLSDPESVDRLRFTLRYLTGYRVPNGSHQGVWRLSVRLDDGRDFLVSEAPTVHDWTVIVKFEESEFLVSSGNEGRIERLFRCRDRFPRR